MYGKIISLFNPDRDYYIIKIDVGDYSFEPGQFTKFSLPSTEIKDGSNFRIFSIANSNPDGTITIGTRAGKERISDFKKKLLSMKKGDEIEVAKPMGSFTVKDTVSPMVLYAAGIGITPIRSILGAIKDQTTRPVHVIYASDDYYMFGEELKEIAANNDHIELNFTRNHWESEKIFLNLAQKYQNSAYYYTSGSPFIVSTTEEAYLRNDIEKMRLLADKFTGY